MWVFFIILLLVSTVYAQPPLSGGDAGQIRSLTQIQGFCSDGEMMQQSAGAWVCVSAPAGGASQILDLADDAANESTNIGEIATTGDTNSIVTEPTADKMLIDMGQAWPTADALSGNGTNCSAGSAAGGVDASGNAEDCTSITATIDLGDDDVNESTGITEIATTGDTNAIATEPTADKLLIDMGKAWPTADALSANGANCSAGQAPIGVDASGAAEGCAALDADDITDDALSSLSNVNADADATDNEILIGDATEYRGVNLPVCNVVTEKLAFDGTSMSCQTDEVGAPGSGDVTDVFDCASGNCSSITLTDGDLLNMSSVAPNTTTEGLILPQAADCSSATAMGQTCVDTTDGSLWVGNSSAAVSIGTINETIQDVFANGGALTTATCESTPLRIGRGGDDYWDLCVDSSDLPTLSAICNGAACPRQETIPTNQTYKLYDDEGAAAMLTVDPDAATVNGMWQYGAGYQPTVSAEVVLRPAGDCSVAEEVVITNGPLGDWITCVDTTGDSVSFDYKTTTKIAGDTTLTLTLVVVNKNAAPSGTFTLDCAARAVRMGVDAYAAHDTTGQQSLAFTGLDTQYRPESESASFTINGTVAAGAHVQGQCNVSATPAQIADIRLSGTAIIELSADSISD